jgi:crotonobetainyl-CoA:carnitine CoA-transferase CaiB-like acyl-CoA transferase
VHADKSSVVVPSGVQGRHVVHGLLDGADVAILDLPPGAARELGLSIDVLRERWPRLVAVWLTCFGPDGPYSAIPGDSFLAEAFGGLATMIGEAGRPPLSLGGEQTAYCSGVTGFLGAMLGLMRRDAGFGGDVVDVAMCDVAAYMDWKSDLVYSMTGLAPQRSGAAAGDWRLVRARDGWVGFIFQQQHWTAVVELVGAPELTDPSLADESVRLARCEQWWPVVERWTLGQSAEDVYLRAQRLGLPFGWVVRPSDLVKSAQLRGRGFITTRHDPDSTPSPVGAPFRSARLAWRSGPAPAPGAQRIRGSQQHVPEEAESAAGSPAPGKTGAEDDRPLGGMVVLDFGTITAGAAVTRLLADYGATVLKIEWPGHPDTFRLWKMPAPPDAGAPGPTSPYFASNNIGKLGVSVNLKSREGRRLVHELARRSHVLVENYRVGVTRRLGIDARSMHQTNPDLVYLSLSSQGQDGPEAENSSYGSTLDLLSGLASVTGYEPGHPLWSSSDVNYPDQLVSLFGAALVVYCLRSGITGSHLDVSQREVVSWTLAAQIASSLASGRDPEPAGNHRPGRTPHDCYPCAEAGTWIAISCFTDQHRRALSECVASTVLARREASWWWSQQRVVDAELTAWTRVRTRERALAELHAADVPAVPVRDAADRFGAACNTARQVALRGDTGFVKGLPMVFRDYEVSPSVTVPGLGQHTRAVLRDLCGLSDGALDELEQCGAIYTGPRQAKR